MVVWSAPRDKSKLMSHTAFHNAGIWDWINSLDSPPAWQRAGIGGPPKRGTRMKFLRMYCAGMLLWLLGSVPATQAHHSIIEFDYSLAYAVTGRVKELQWTNPHSWVQVMVPDASGNEVEFGFELGAPVFNIRLGWAKDSVVPGDIVTVVYCPS